MNLDIKQNKIISNEFIQGFAKELKKVLFRMENQELSNEEELKYSAKKSEIYRDFLEDNEYVLHRKYNAPGDDRYKIAKYEGTFEKLNVIHENDLISNDVNVGDIIVKTENGYMLNKEKTEFIKRKLNEIKQEIMNNR